MAGMEDEIVAEANRFIQTAGQTASQTGDLRHIQIQLFQAPFTHNQYHWPLFPPLFSS